MIPAQPEQDQFGSWFGKVNNTFKLPKNFSVQFTAVYNSKTVLPPGGSGGGRGGGMGMMLVAQHHQQMDMFAQIIMRTWVLNMNF